MSKKRILMLNYEFPPLGGGAANATKYILKEFAKYDDMKIDLITSSTSNFKIENFASNITIHYLDIGKNNKNRLNQTNKELLIYSKKTYFYCKKLVQINNYDLCHAFFGIPCGFIAKRLGLPYIVSLRGSDVPFYSQKYYWLDKLAFRRLSINIWNNANSVIANSEGLRDLAYQTKSDKTIGVIYNGIDCDEFICKSNYKTSKTIRIIAGTRLIKRKGFIYLIRALKELKNVKLSLIGEGSEFDILKNEANKLGVDVDFLGFIEHNKISSILLQQDLYVLPSFNEGMCNFTLEAMASGLPILVTDIGGTKELLKDNGFLIKKKNSNDIRKKIEIFLNDFSLIEKMGKKSRKIAENMNWTGIAKSYYNEYNKK